MRKPDEGGEIPFKLNVQGSVNRVKTDFVNEPAYDSRCFVS